ncbi:hypothetical protein ES705_25846 [subsurface metagenome]
MNQEKKQKRVERAPEKIEESLSYTVEVRDKEGRVIHRVSAPSRSYVEQWNQIVCGHVGQHSVPCLDTNGVESSAANQEEALDVTAGIGDVTHGIRIGKGTTAVAIDDYALETPLGEGTGTDEFNHQVVTFTEPSVVGSTCSFALRRTMINISGATISDIKEIGCYVRISASRYAMGFRDVLPSAVYVPHSGSITVTYTIKVTV